MLRAFRGISISKIRHGETSIEFDAQAKETASVLTGIKIEGKQLQQVHQLAPKNVAQIAEAWKELEELVRQRLKSNGVDPGALTDAESVIDVASKRGLLTTDQTNSLRGLLTMRSLAVHSREGEITDARTTDFLVLASAMKTVLQISEGDIGKQVAANVSAGVIGQGDLATMNYTQLRSRLLADFPVLKA